MSPATMLPQMTSQVAADIDRELQRQIALKESGRFTFTCQEMPDLDNLSILVEELGEVAQAVEGGDVASLREELVQLAAVASGWVKRIDTERSGRASYRGIVFGDRENLRRLSTVTHRLGEVARAINDRMQQRDLHDRLVSSVTASVAWIHHGNPERSLPAAPEAPQAAA